jgi:hypothetical protein
MNLQTKCLLLGVSGSSGTFSPPDGGKSVDFDSCSYHLTVDLPARIRSYGCTARAMKLGKASEADAWQFDKFPLAVLATFAITSGPDGKAAVSLVAIERLKV